MAWGNQLVKLAYIQQYIYDENYNGKKKKNKITNQLFVYHVSHHDSNLTNASLGISLIPG